MNDEQQALLRACAADPANDLPRLVYADWLDEHGDPARAEFIRCDIGAADASLGPDERAAHQRRASELLAAHRDDWDAPLVALGVAQLFPEPPPRVTYERGLPVEAVVPVEAFLVNGASIHAVAPTVTRLDMNSQQFGNAVAIRLAACPDLSWVTSLDLRANGLGDAAAEALASSPHLGGLRHLDLWLNTIRAAGLHALRDSPYFPPDMMIAVEGFVPFGDDPPSFSRFRELVAEWRIGRPGGRGR